MRRDELAIPLSIFEKANCTAFEAIVQYLHEEKHLRLSDIAKLLERDPRTIWTVYERVKKKQ